MTEMSNWSRSVVVPQLAALQHPLPVSAANALTPVHIVGGARGWGAGVATGILRVHPSPQRAEGRAAYPPSFQFVCVLGFEVVFYIRGCVEYMADR